MPGPKKGTFSIGLGNNEVFTPKKNEEEEPDEINGNLIEECHVQRGGEADNINITIPPIKTSTNLRHNFSLSDR